MVEPIISTLHTGFTSLGTSTAKTQLGGAAVILPAWARSILAVIPNVTIDVPTAAESVLVQAAVESNDVNTVPFECLAAPIGAALGATTGTATGPNESYAMNVPVSGGEQISVYETALVANTAAPTGGATLVVSNMPPTLRQRHAKCGTITNTGTTASSDVAGTRYNFSGAKRIVELIGMLGHTTVAAASAVTGYIKYTSNEFPGVSNAILSLNPISAGLSTLIPTFIPGVSRADVSIPVDSGQVNVQDYLYMGLAPTVTGNFIDGVVYESSKMPGLRR